MFIVSDAILCLERIITLLVSPTINQQVSRPTIGIGMEERVEVPIRNTEKAGPGPIWAIFRLELLTKGLVNFIFPDNDVQNTYDIMADRSTSVCFLGS